MTKLMRKNIDQLSYDLDRFFDNLFYYSWPRLTRWNDYSYLDAKQPMRSHITNDGILNIEFDVPGCDKKDLQVSYHNGLLEVSTKKNELKRDGENTSNFKHEVYYSVRAKDLDIDSIKASCNNGVLTLLAKSLETKNKINIEVK